MLFLTNALGPSWQTASHTHEKIYKEDHNHNQQRHQLNVLPPHPPPQPSTPHPKLMRTPSQAIRLINQQINPLPSLKHSFDILSHYSAHILNLVLDVAYRVCFSRRSGAVLNHQLLQCGVEASRAIIWQAPEIGRVQWELLKESILDLDQESERNSAAGTARRDDEEGEASC